MERNKESKIDRFKRLTGVPNSTFELLVEAVNEYDTKVRKRGKIGRKSHLITEDKLLMILMYLREYRTMFHIGVAYGLSESNVCRTIKFVEQAFISHPSLHLPGKGALTQSDNSFEVVLIDVAETPIERLSNANIILAKKKKTHKNTNRSRQTNTKKIICVHNSVGRIMILNF
ncbi:MAG: transposase family protein [Chitinophagales bacterium]